ncbi:MAG: AMP-binding protein [Spirochaetota bacterium]
MLPSRDTILRIVVDLLAETLAIAGKGPGARAITADTEISEGVLGLDSVGVLSAAGRINSFFHLYETGTEDNLLRARRVGDWVDQVSAAFQKGVQSLCFRTSGSTGEPKEVHHKLSHLRQEAEWLASYFSSRRRVIATVSARHIYGFLLTGLVPDILNVPVVDGRTFNARTWLKDLRSEDLIASYPDYWRFLDHSVPGLVDGVWGVSSTAPTPRDLVRALEAKGVGRFVEIYGATETAGVGIRSDPDVPFELFPFWRRNEPRDGSDRLRRIGPGGDTGAPVEAERHDAAGGHAQVAGESVQVMDELEWVGPRTFRPLRRRDNAVQVGGTNVFPALIESRLMRLPEVQEAHVRLMRPSEGDRLKAVIVPNRAQPIPEVRQRVHRWIQENLSPPERPTALTLVKEIPRDVMGKRLDWSIYDPGDWE